MAFPRISAGITGALDDANFRRVGCGAPLKLEPHHSSKSSQGAVRADDDLV
jgi:hypothetical protein